MVSSQFRRRGLETKRFLSTQKVKRETFWQDLGSPKFISAPMVDQSNMAWRVFVRRHGVDLTFTQMVHSKNFVKDKKYRQKVVDWLDYKSTCGASEKEEEAKRLDRPLIVQLAGDDPSCLAETARIIEGHGVTAIDLNLGCPQNIARRGHYGAFLLPERELVVQLLSSIIAATSCPVTAKIRKLPREEDTLALAKAIEATGVSMLTVHGRLVTQNKQYTGITDWDTIRNIKQSLHIPVIANGGIEYRADALRCLEYTGADAVMSSEGLLQNPKLFSIAGDEEFRQNFLRAQLQSAKEYLELVVTYPIPYSAESVVRGHLIKMLYRLLMAETNFDVRDEMVKGSLATMKEMVDKLDLRMRTISYDIEYAISNNMVSTTNWYYRHRK